MSGDVKTWLMQLIFIVVLVFLVVWAAGQLGLHF